MSRPDLTLLRELRQVDRVLLTGPVAPDGDSLGACLALRRMLAHHDIPATVVADAPRRYDWLPDADTLIADTSVDPSWPAVVVLDGDRHRLAPEVAVAFAAANVTGIVDHHASTDPTGYTAAWIAPTLESTCGMLLRVLDDWGVDLDVDLATLLYAGMVFDTGGFRFSNTTPETHRLAARLVATGLPHAEICARILTERRPVGLAALGAVVSAATYGPQLCTGRVDVGLQHRLGLEAGDLEGIVDLLVHQTNVDVAALLVERDDGHIKVSLRSRGTIDVSAVARELTPGGGGHAKASGARLAATLDETETRVRALVAHRRAGQGPEHE